MHSPMTRHLTLTAAFLALVLGLATPAMALFTEVTVADEAEMGREFHQQIVKSMPLVEDPMITGYVEDVVQRVVDAMPPQPYRVTSTVIRNGSMNAFAVPGGYVYVLTGLMLNLKTEDQLAAVICHEMGHVSQRHVAKRMEDMELASIGSYVGLIAGAFLGATGGENNRNLGQALMMTSQAGAATAFLVYTKANEVEADHVGLTYLVDAGYRPQALAETFQIMLDKRWGMTGNKSLPSYLSTHPAMSERMAYLRLRTKELPPKALAQRADNSRFLRVQAVIRGNLSDPTASLAHFNSMAPGDFTCLDYMSHGMVLARVNKQAEATHAFERALECGGNDPLVLREAGGFFFRSGQFDKAEPLLKKALVRDPTDALTLFYNARLLGEKKQFPQAIKTMRLVLKEVPRDAEVHYHLGRLLGESGDLFAAHLHLAYSALYGHDIGQAKFHGKRAEGLARTPDQKERMEELKEEMKLYADA
ncbi:Putative Zn-dependent protease, contains TPR repeats [Paucidesulfovibrio gracilis DSM 16080]|uniref:Putative Zn-dependent protease, contains TPR repeats n=1 Tax=Paucidesulfovibrio gracilis DSM 16080 TaxID=1121449 RepID=A0A1T4W460_9BACT|nr:M48 family metallopeptidase [Paucidesulfovibrio gracilis]SKA72036.1 Putative Zn-dependent protease, contains TPR repeats [Paucidesulfovibrio gracilis DSM 16080]